MFSERVNPWMALVKSTAETIRETRDPLPEDHPAIVTERALSARTGEVLGAWRKGRDAWITHVFGAIFGPLPGIPSPAQADHPDAVSHKE